MTMVLMMINTVVVLFSFLGLVFLFSYSFLLCVGRWRNVGALFVFDCPTGDFPCIAQNEKNFNIAQ